MGKGIDYGMGQTNVDRANGIRYGVISMNALSHWAWEDVESDYGPPTCGRCGNEAEEYDDEKHGEFKGKGSDYACGHCGRVYWSDECYGDEPIGHNIDSDGVVATIDSYNDAFVTKSPYFTRAQFCSPCAPGACHLENPDEDGERAYCFGHDWFEGGVAPYPVYSVATGELVPAPAK